MKKIFTLFLFIVVIAFVIFTLYWKKESEKIQNGIETHINSLNSEGNGFKLSFDRLSVDGYPFEFKAALLNSTINFLSSKVGGEVQGDVKTTGEMVMHFSLEGDLTSIDYAGDTIFTPSHSADVGAAEYLFQAKAIVKNEKAPLLKGAVKLLSQDDGDFWGSISAENLAIHLEDLHLVSKNFQKSILSVGVFDARFSMLPLSEDNQKIQFQLKADDVDYSELLAYLMDKNENGNFNDSLNRDFVEALYKRLGRVNEEFKFELDIPSLAQWVKVLKGLPMTLLQDAWPAATLKIQNAYQFKDKLMYEGQLYFAVKNLSPGIESSTIESKLRYDFTKGYREAIVAAIREVSQQAAALKATTPEEKAFQDFVVTHPDLIEGLIPDFQALGGVESSLDLELGVDKENLDVQVDLDAFEILTKLYGIKIQGKGRGSLGSVKGDLIFNLIHYKRLITAGVAYINKCIAMANIAFKESLPHLEAISPSLQDKILNFLDEIGDQEQKFADNLTVTVIASDELFTVGKVSGSEFAEKAKALIDDITKEVLP